MPGYTSWISDYWSANIDIQPPGKAYWSVYFGFLALLMVTCCSVAAFGAWGVATYPEDARYGKVFLSSFAGMFALTGYLSGQPLFVVVLTLMSCFIAVAGAAGAMLGLV